MRIKQTTIQPQTNLNRNKWMLVIIVGISMLLGASFVFNNSDARTTAVTQMFNNQFW